MKILLLCRTTSFVALSCSTLIIAQPSYIEKKRDYEKIDPMTVRLTDLADGFCIPCHGGVKPLTINEQEKLLQQVPGWTINRSTPLHKLTRSFNFSSFSETMNFINAIMPVAEREKHHPDISFSYNSLKLEIYTHAINGLSLNDYVLAAKLNKLKPSFAHEKLVRPTTNIKWTKRLNKTQIISRLSKIGRWDFEETPYHKLIRKTTWKNFTQAMEFINHLASYTNKVKYFPDVYLYYNKVNIEMYSHLPSREIRDSDFVVARGIDLIISWLKQTIEKRNTQPHSLRIPK